MRKPTTCKSHKKQVVQPGQRDRATHAPESLFEPPFEGLRGNVCTLSIAHWKARGRLSIHHNLIELFSLSLAVETP